MSCARPSTLRLSLSKIEYFVPAGIAGLAAGVTVRLVAPPIAVIWNTWRAGQRDDSASVADKRARSIKGCTRSGKCIAADRNCACCVNHIFSTHKKPRRGGVDINQNGLFTGGTGERVCTHPVPVEGVSGTILRLIILFSDAINLHGIFLPANHGRSCAYGLLSLKNASAAGQQDNRSQAEN
jgi:hypothetical protein